MIEAINSLPTWLVIVYTIILCAIVLITIIAVIDERKEKRNQKPNIYDVSDMD